MKLISNAEQGEHHVAMHANRDSPASPAQRCTEEQGWCTPCAFTTQDSLGCKVGLTRKCLNPKAFPLALTVYHAAWSSVRSWPVSQGRKEACAQLPAVPGF